MSHTIDVLEEHIKFLENQLTDIRELIETEMGQDVWGITALYHRRTELRDAIYEVLER